MKTKAPIIDYKALRASYIIFYQNTIQYYKNEATMQASD